MVQGRLPPSELPSWWRRDDWRIVRDRALRAVALAGQRSVGGALCWFAGSISAKRFELGYPPGVFWLVVPSAGSCWRPIPQSASAFTGSLIKGAAVVRPWLAQAPGGLPPTAGGRVFRRERGGVAVRCGDRALASERQYGDDRRHRSGDPYGRSDDIFTFRCLGERFIASLNDGQAHISWLRPVADPRRALPRTNAIAPMPLAGARRAGGAVASKMDLGALPAKMPLPVANSARWQRRWALEGGGGLHDAQTDRAAADDRIAAAPCQGASCGSKPRRSSTLPQTILAALLG